MFHFPQTRQPAAAADADADLTGADRLRAREAWHSLVDAVDADCPSLEDDTVGGIAARPLFDGMALPEDTDKLLPAGPRAAAGVDSFIRQGHLDWSKTYGRAFVRQVDASEQFHPVPLPLGTGQSADHLDGLPDGAPEGTNFKELLYSGGQNPVGNHFDATGVVVHDDGLGGNDEDDDDLSPYGESRARKNRRLDRTAAGNLMTPAEREMRLQEIMSEHRTERLNAMFTSTMRTSTAERKKADFLPIILIPPTSTAPLQIFNIYSFLHDGAYVDPHKGFIDHETGAASRRRRDVSVTVSPGAFLESTDVGLTRFEVFDDPAQLRPDQWKHVCAAFVTEEEWQFNDWFPQDPLMSQPSNLFVRVRGFMPFFVEDRQPHRVRTWNVQPIRLTRTASRRSIHIEETFRFWAELYKHLASHEFFGQYY